MHLSKAALPHGERELPLHNDSKIEILGGTHLDEREQERRGEEEQHHKLQSGVRREMVEAVS